MNFNKKIMCSLVSVLLLSACESEDKYKAKECINCMPSENAGENEGEKKADDPIINDNNNINISISKDDQNITWEKKDTDEEVLGMVLSSQNTLVYSKWNNRLTIINPNTKTISSDDLYLDVTGGRYSSGETVLVDATTGASEQTLAKVLVNDDGTTVFSLLEKYDDDSKDIGIGIYSDDISNGVPDARFATRVTTSANYFSYPTARDIALSHDGQTIVAGGDDRKINIFDANNLNSPREINAGRKVRSLNFSADDNHIFSGSSGLKKHIKIFNVASGVEEASIETSGIPKEVVEIPNSNKIIAIFLGSNKVRVYDITDITTPTLNKTLIINGSAKSISISPDKKTFAITATGKQVNLFTINGSNTPKVISLDENANGATFLSENKLMIATGTSIVYYTISLGN